MANLFNEAQTTDMFSGVTKDETMDLSKFLQQNSTAGNSHDNSMDYYVNTAKTVKPEPARQYNDEIDARNYASPLAKELEKRKSQPLGYAITKEEFEAGKEKTELRNMAESDQRLHDLEQAQMESDFLLKQRQAIIPLKQYSSGPEYAQMVHEISLVRFDDNGKAYFKYDTDEDGNIIPVTTIRLRTENDPPFSMENDKKQMAVDHVNRERAANGQEPISAETIEKSKAESDSMVDETETVSAEKKKVVQFIIDKTGLGADFTLSEEEKAKVVEADEIRLKQVRVLDIASIRVKKPEPDTFRGKIHEYTLSGTKTTICFPASGFKADMSALTYGEVGDISLSMDSVNVDKYYKRLAIVYNKMKNISSGPFDSFETFLKNLAYTDIPLAIYGLYVSTYPEVQSIALRCGNKACAQTFDWNFSTRSILKLEKSDEVFLDHMKELTAADPDQYDEIYKKAPVRNIQYIELPNCGYIVGFGIASAWEFLYNFIPVLDEQTFKDAFGDDINQVYLNNMLLLTTVLRVYVPNHDEPGTYILCEGYKDILDAIYNINPEEIKIVAAMSSKIQSEYQTYFSFNDVVCPHCKNKTNEIDLTIDDLVFQTYQRLLSTEIDLTNIQSI